MIAAALAVLVAAWIVARRRRQQRGAYRLIVAFAPAACRQRGEG